MYAKENQVVIMAKFEGKEFICGCNINKPKPCLCKDCDETVFKEEVYKNIKDCIENTRDIDTSKI